MTPQAVVFDIGNVLIGWDPEAFFDSKIGASQREKLFAQVPLTDMNNGVDRGDNFYVAVARTKAAFPGWEREIQMWQDHWIEMASPAIAHSVRLKDALRAKGVPVLALSNFGVQTFEIAKKRYPFLTGFDQSYISGHLKTIKPEVRIYEILEAGCGVAPEALLFADDRADNLAVAAARGWQTHLFDGPEGWAKRLIEEGLLTEAEAA